MARYLKLVFFAMLCLCFTGADLSAQRKPALSLDEDSWPEEFLAARRAPSPSNGNKLSEMRTALSHRQSVKFKCIIKCGIIEVMKMFITFDAEIEQESSEREKAAEILYSFSHYPSLFGRRLKSKEKKPMI
jgi:hypothetical protein